LDGLAEQGPLSYPTRNFARVAPYVAIGLGPYHRLTIGREPAGVWPLRIPETETVAGDSYVL